MQTTLKTATFAVTHFSVAFGVAWLLTGSFVIGGLVALVEPAVNTVAYVIHEKLWSRVRRGENPADEISQPQSPAVAMGPLDHACVR